MRCRLVKVRVPTVVVFDRDGFEMDCLLHGLDPEDCFEDFLDNLVDVLDKNPWMVCARC